MDKFYKFTRGTRHDFHEPDEQNIEFVRLQGDHLDNAFGSLGECGELVVVLKKDSEEYRFNLADILGLAKTGVEKELGYGKRV